MLTMNLMVKQRLHQPAFAYQSNCMFSLPQDNIASLTSKGNMVYIASDNFVSSDVGLSTT